MNMNDKLEKMWKWSWSILKYYPSICLEGLQKTTKTPATTASLWTKIQTQELPTIMQKC